MSYRAKVVKVMIASPSDVSAERQAIRNVIQEWNFAHSEDKGIVLMPIGWESHSSPSMGGRPQAIINKQVLADCDLLIAVFWTKLGTPTGKSASGTVEEIDEHVKAKKPAMIYFSSIPVQPATVDAEQLKALQEFKGQLQQRGLYAEYESAEEFRQKLARQLAQTVNRYFAPKKNGPDDSQADGVAPPTMPSVSEPARNLLIGASQEEDGLIFRSRTMSGWTIQTKAMSFTEGGDEARWEGALKELAKKGLIQDRGRKGEVYAVTDDGYRAADLLKERQLVPL